MKYLCILLLSLLITTKSFAPNSKLVCKSEVKITKIKSEFNVLERKIIKSDIDFDKVVAYIKKYEGFSHKPYNDLNTGLQTIGYGCIIKYSKGISNHITKQQGDSLLRIRLNKMIKEVSKIYPNLNKNQTLAIAHMYYKFGIKRVIDSNLIQNNDIDTIKLLKIGQNKKWSKIANKKFLENRQFEINLFYNLNIYKL